MTDETPERIDSELKAERIQSQLKAERIQSKLKAERIQAHFADLPEWEPSEEGTGIERTYTFRSTVAAAHFVPFVIEAGRVDGFVPQVRVKFSRVTVTIQTREGGVVEQDFKIARWVDGRL